MLICAEALGVKQHSYLWSAIAQTQLVHQVLLQRGDGEAAFVSIPEVLGSEEE